MSAHLAHLADDDARSRQAALDALAEVAPEKLLAHAEALKAALADPEWFVRRAAAAALSQLDAEDLEDVMDFGQARATPRKLLTNSWQRLPDFGRFGQSHKNV